jgi:hypothetical protein
MIERPRYGSHGRRLLQILSLVLLLSAFTLPWRAAPAIFSFPLFEDGYYSLTIARALAAGHGPTVDGVHRTSGFQPLWVILIAPLSWIVRGDRELFVRLALAAHWVLYAACAIGIGVLTRQMASSRGDPPPALAGPLATALYLASATILALHFNGLETGLTLALYLLVGWRALRVDWSSPRDVVILGALCGLLILARIDAVFFVILLAPVSGLGLPGVSRRGLVRATALLNGTALAVSMPWWIYNLAVFHRLMPQSGTAEADYGFFVGRIVVFAGFAVRTALPLPFDFLWPDWVFRPIAYGLVAVGLLLALRVLLALRRHPEDRPARLAIVLAGSVAILGVWYGLTSAAWWMYLRYSAPLLLLSVPVVTLALLRISRGRAQPAILGAIMLAGTAGAVANLHGHLGPVTAMSANLVQVELARRVVSEDAVVGALQTGTLGYFRDRTVNLDGKVNVAALARRADLDAYCREEGIDWLVDVDWLLKRDVFRSEAVPPSWRQAAVAPVPDCEWCTVAAYVRVR